MKFLEIFNEVQKGNFALTDEAMYNSIAEGGDFIPVYGGAKSHNDSDKSVSAQGKTNENKPITVFSGDGIIISLDGSAGCMTVKRGERFALNHHAGFFTAKDEKKINLDYFCIFYQNMLQNLGVSDGSKTLSLDQLYSIDFEIPSYEAQKRVLAIIGRVKKKIEELQYIRERIEKLLVKQISVTYTKMQCENKPVAEIFDCLSGNVGLTGEFVYSVANVVGEKYTILSGAMDENKMMGEIPFCQINGKDLKVFKDEEGVLVVRKGKAGALQYLAKGNYAINDDAYILSVKKGCQYKIDLHWFMIQYKSEFLSYSSSSDNGTWNKTGFFENVRIDIPDYSEQKRVSKSYANLETKLEKCKAIERKYMRLMSKTISLPSP